MVKIVQLFIAPALAFRERSVRETATESMFLEAEGSSDPMERVKNQCFFVAQQLRYEAKKGEFDLDYTSDDYKYNAKLKNWQRDDVSHENILSFFKTTSESPACEPIIATMTPDDFRLNKKQKKKKRQEAKAWEYVKGYGCYCSFGEEAQDYGRGTAVNALDEKCQYAHMNYQCLEEEDPHCKELSRETYFVFVETDASQGISLNDACHRYNAELQAENGWSDEDLACVQKRCLIDSEFINDVISITFDAGYSFTDAYVRPEEGGDFQYQDECPNEPGPEEYAKICCGKYPYRFIYHPARAACCEHYTPTSYTSVAYRVEDQACCNDGSIATYGDTDFNNCHSSNNESI